METSAPVIVRNTPVLDKRLTICSTENEPNTHSLTRIYSPPLILDNKGFYTISLESASLWYMWFNVASRLNNNIIRFKILNNWYEIHIPDGIYMTDGLNGVISQSFLDLVSTEHIDKNELFTTTDGGISQCNVYFTNNYNTGKLELHILQNNRLLTDVNCLQFDLLNAPYSNINELLEFSPKVYLEPYTVALKTANFERNISQININCSLISGESYYNGLGGQNILYSHTIDTGPGLLMSIKPTNMVQIAIPASTINEIKIWLTDNLNRQIIMGNGDEPVTYNIILRRHF